MTKTFDKGFWPMLFSVQLQPISVNRQQAVCSSQFKLG